MTIEIKEIKYLIPPRDILNDALDVFVTLNDDYCKNEFFYYVEVITPQFLLTIMEKEKSNFLLPDYPCIIVSQLTDDIIKAALESFINSDSDVRWLKLYHLMPKLDIREIDEILYRKNKEEIEIEARLNTEFEIE